MKGTKPYILTVIACSCHLFAKSLSSFGFRYVAPPQRGALFKFTRTLSRYLSKQDSEYYVCGRKTGKSEMKFRIKKLL